MVSFARVSLILLLGFEAALAIDNPLASPKPSPTPAAKQNSVSELEAALADARVLQTAAAETSATAPESFGATMAEVEEKRSLIARRVMALENRLSATRMLEEIHRAGADLATEIDAWKGFPEPGPYPMSLADELQGQARAVELAIQRDEFQQEVWKNLIATARNEVKSAEQTLRRLTEQLEAETDAVKKTRLSWLHGLATLRLDVAQSVLLSGEAKMSALAASIGQNRTRIGFIQRKLQVVSASAKLTEKELEQRLRGIQNEIEALGKERRAASREESLAWEALKKSRDLLRSARETLDLSGPDAEKNRQEINKLADRVESDRVRAETTKEISEELRLVDYALKAEELVWQSRFRLASQGTHAERASALEDITKKSESLAAYGAYFRTNFKLIYERIGVQEDRLQNWSANDGDAAPAQATLDFYRKRARNLERGALSITRAQRLLDNWKAEITGTLGSAGKRERVRAISERLQNSLVYLWNFELFSADDSVVVDGQRIVQPRPVTVGKISRALLLLLVGLMVASRGAGWIRSHLCRKVSPAAARLGGAVVSAILTIGVVIAAMAMAKIPLTVFAFLGGALAIGIGFGAQNLINNFISSFILLTERPIRVDDTVELQGTRGTVQRIGSRCVHIRRFDGVDILVPNSAFLEKEVVNWTLSDDSVRFQFSIGVAYGSPTREVARILTEALDEHGVILKEPAPDIIFADFGENALIFTVYFWLNIRNKTDFRRVSSDLRHMLAKRFADAGIELAYPQRDVHLDAPNALRVEIVKG